MISRLRSWSQSTFKRIWLHFLLSTSTIITIFTALNKSRWITGSHISIVWMLSLGFLLGILLAKSQFPGWVAVLFSIILSSSGVIQNGMGVIQPFSLIREITFPAYLNLTHLSTIAFLRQLSTWTNTFFETGKFVSPLTSLLSGFVIWNLCAWMAWWLINRRQAITGMLPMGFFIALHVQQYRQNINILLAYLAIMLMLISHLEYNNLISTWDKKQIDYPLDFGLDWPASAIAFILLLTVLGSVAPIIGTAEGHQQIIDFFATEEEILATEKITALSDSNQMAYTAELVIDFSPPSTTEHTVMWVSISDPPPPQSDMIPIEAVEQYYWRSEIFTTYTGKSWQTSESIPFPEENLPIQTDLYPGRRQIEQTYEILLPHGEKLFAINRPISTDPVSVLHTLSTDNSLFPSGEISTYRVSSWVADLDSQKLTAIDDQPTPQDIQDTYLQLPNDLPQRVSDLANGLTAQSITRFEKTMRIQDYLRRTYLYDLNTPPPPSDQDIVDYFLFDAPSGFCSHYASAMVVMLRSVGVPSRLVTGYVQGDFSPSRNAYRVPASAAHAWVEVYFPVYGWIEFEPTPTRPSHRYENLDQHIPEDNAVQTIDVSSNMPHIVWLMLSIAGTAFIALICLRLTKEKRKRNNMPQINIYYNRIQLLLNQMGIIAEPGTTPNEYLQNVQGVLDTSKLLYFAFAQLTKFYIQESFGPRPLNADQIKYMKECYQTANKEWRKWKIRSLATRVFQNQQTEIK